MAFLIKIKSICTEIEDNNLSLTVGGVRAYNLENLYSKKSPERFKVFIGFKNSVCTNLCVSTDGFKTDIRVFNLHELFENSASLINGFNHSKQSNFISELNQFSLSEEQFSKLIGRSKMFQYMPVSFRGQLAEMPLGDSQLNSVIKGYYGDDNFSCRSDGSIDLWRLYNLFTGATKSSYIDTYLDKCALSHSFVAGLKESLQNNGKSWYIS